MIVTLRAQKIIAFDHYLASTTWSHVRCFWGSCTNSTTIFWNICMNSRTIYPLLQHNNEASSHSRVASRRLLFDASTKFCIRSASHLLITVDSRFSYQCLRYRWLHRTFRKWRCHRRDGHCKARRNMRRDGLKTVHAVTNTLISEHVKLVVRCVETPQATLEAMKWTTCSEIANVLHLGNGVH